MNRLKRLLFACLCSICLHFFSLLGGSDVQASHVLGAMSQQQQNTQPTAAVEKMGNLQNGTTNVTSVDVLGAAHNAKMAISTFINALNNWEDAQTAAGLLPNIGNLQNDTSLYLQNKSPDEAKEVKKSKKKKKKKKAKKNKKDKKSKKKKKGNNNERQAENAQASEGEDWKDVVPDETAAVEYPYRSFVFAENSSTSQSKQSYRLDTENLKQFHKELEEYRNEKDSTKA